MEALVTIYKWPSKNLCRTPSDWFYQFTKIYRIDTSEALNKRQTMMQHNAI